MYSSEKADNIEDNRTTDNPKTDEKHPKMDKTEETCQEKEFMHNAPVSSSVKRNSEGCFENKPEWSTDNVRKQSNESLLHCTNVQDILLAEDQLWQIQSKLNSVTFPNKRKESTKESANQADESANKEKSINSEESSSAAHAIKVSILKYFSSAFNQFENYQSKRLLLESIVSIIINGIINIVEVLKAELNKNQQTEISGKPTSKSIASETIGMYDFSKDNTKRIDGYATDNEQSQFEKSEITCPKCMQDRLRSPIISPGNRKYEQIDEEIKWKQSADNSTIDVKNDENFTNSLNVRDSELCFISSPLEIVKSKEINSPITVGSKSSFEDKLISQNKGMASKDLGKINHFSENTELVFPKTKQESMEKLHFKMLENDKPLQMNRTLTDTSKCGMPNTTKSSKYRSLEEMPQLEETGRRHPWENIERHSLLKLFSDSECDSFPIHNEPELNIINIKHLKNDPNFIECQKRILESISSQRQPHSNMNCKSDDKENLPESIKNEGVIEVRFRVFIKTVLKVYNMVRCLDDFLKLRGRNSDDLTELELITLLMKIAQVCDPDCIAYIPRVIYNYRECMKKLPKAINIACQRSIEEILESNSRTLNLLPLVDTSSDTLIIDSPDSSTPENEPDYKISETSFPQFREYPGLAKDPTNVKKDARYQKKFYKQNNPVRLPIEWKQSF